MKNRILFTQSLIRLFPFILFSFIMASCGNGKKKEEPKIMERFEVPFSRQLLEQDAKRNREMFRNLPASPADPYEEAYEEGYKKGRSAGYEEGYNERK